MATTLDCSHKESSLNKDKSAHHVWSTSPLSVSLEHLLCSVVRVGCRIDEEKAFGPSGSCKISFLTEDEKAYYIDKTHLWIEDCSSPSCCATSSITCPGVHNDVCEMFLDEISNGYCSFDKGFLETVLRGSLWGASTCAVDAPMSQQEERKENEGVVQSTKLLNIEILEHVVHDLVRVLQQRHDKNTIFVDAAVKQNEFLGFIEQNEVKNMKLQNVEEMDEETRRVFAIMAKAFGRLSPYSAADIGNEVFFVGLVCYEQDGELPHGDISVRPFSTTSLTCFFDSSGEMAKNCGRGCGKKEGEYSPVSVLLLAVEVAKTVNDQLYASSMWQALLSVVDFVYVSGSSVFVDQVALLINKTYRTAVVATSEMKHSGAGCCVQQPECPFFFYTVAGEAPVSVEQCPGKALYVNSLLSLLHILVCPEEPQLSSCSRDLLQWLLLFESTWRLVGDTRNVASLSPFLSNFLSLPLRETIGAAVRNAVEIFVCTSEALLLTMRSMEPLPPFFVRGENVGAVTVATRQFTLEDILLIARRVALLAYEVDVMPCVFKGCLTPRNALLQGEYCGCRRHAAREGLYAAFQLEAEFLKERLFVFSTHCAAQALMSWKVVQGSLLSDENGGNGCLSDGVFFVKTIHDYADKIEGFLASPLISHCVVQAKDEENPQKITKTPTKSNHFTHTGATLRLGRRRRKQQECRMVESPITFPFAQKAKAVVLSEYLQQSFIPALFDIAQRYESALSKKKQEVSEAREALFVMEDRCMQFQHREEQTESELKQRQSALREAKHCSSRLAAQLAESCKCLHGMITTCVGYKEMHTTFTEKLNSYIRRNCVMNDMASFLVSFTDHSQKDKNNATCNDSFDMTSPKTFRKTEKGPKGGEIASLLGASNAEKVGGASGNGEQALSSLLTTPSLDKMEFLKVLLRDTHLQLEACYNVVLSTFEAARRSFCELCTTFSELDTVNFDVFSLLSHSPLSQTAEDITSVGRCFNPLDEFGEDAVNQNGFFQILSKAKRDFLGGIEVIQRRETLTKHEVHVDNQAETGATNIGMTSPLGKVTGSPSHNVALDGSKQQNVFVGFSQTQQSPKEQQNHSDFVSGHSLHSSFFCHTATQLLHTPERAKTAAVDALADLQRQRQEAVEALAGAEKRCELLEWQLEEERAALRNAERLYATKEQEWNSERGVLLNKINAAGAEAQLAREAELKGRQETERLAQSLTEMLAFVDVEMKKIVEKNGGLSNSGYRYAKKVERITEKENGGREIEEWCVVDLHEAIRIGRMQLCSFLADIDAMVCSNATKVVEERTAALCVELHCAKEELRERELQMRASTEAAFCVSEEQARTAKKVEQLQKALVTIEEREKKVHFDCSVLEMRMNDFCRYLIHVEKTQTALFDLWCEVTMERCGYILQHWWEVSKDFYAEKRGLFEKLEQSQAVTQRWEEVAHHHFDAVQKAAANVNELTRMLEQHKLAQAVAERQLPLLYCRLNKLSAAYVESFVTCEEFVAQRCELLLQQWGRLSLPPQRDDSSLLGGKCSHLEVVDTGDPCGFRYELLQKKRRIAELEEGLRQKKIVCEALTESVLQLNKLLNMQRELGMAGPPPPPLLSPSFGVLHAPSPTSAEGSPLANTFFVSPNRLGESRMIESERQSGGLDKHLTLSAKGCHAVGFTEENNFVAPVNFLDAAGEKAVVVRPRPLNWYLQSFAAIESTLTR